jgi:hypothetical protein
MLQMRYSRVEYKVISNASMSPSLYYHYLKSKRRTHTPPPAQQENNIYDGGRYPRNSFNSSDSSSNELKLNGAKGQPANSANLEKDSTQASRSECNMALVPSIHTRMMMAVSGQLVNNTTQ